MRATSGSISRTSDQRMAWVAWLLAALEFAMVIGTIALYIPARSVHLVGTWGIGGDSGLFVFVVAPLALPIVGALIASRHPANPIGWIFLAGGGFWMLNQLAYQYGVYGVVVRPGAVPLAAQVGSLGEWLAIPAAGLIGIYLLLLFPDGKLLSRRWIPLAWFVGAVIVLLSLSILLTPRFIESLGGVRNPFWLEGYPADALIAGRLLIIVCQLAAAVSLVVRYRRSVGEERQQMKWIAFAAALLGILWLAATIGAAFVLNVN